MKTKTMQGTNKITICKITLLSLASYEQFKGVIPSIDENWWLSTSCNNSNYAIRVCCDGHSLYSNINEYIGVRPAVLIDIESPRYYFQGDKIRIGKYNWTVLETYGSFMRQKLFVLCDDIVVYRNFDSKNNDWSTSALNYWLQKCGIKFILRPAKHRFEWRVRVFSSIKTLFL